MDEVFNMADLVYLIFNELVKILYKEVADEYISGMFRRIYTIQDYKRDFLKRAVYNLAAVNRTTLYVYKNIGLTYKNIPEEHIFKKYEISTIVGLKREYYTNILNLGYLFRLEEKALPIYFIHSYVDIHSHTIEIFIKDSYFTIKIENDYGNINLSTWSQEYKLTYYFVSSEGYLNLQKIFVEAPPKAKVRDDSFFFYTHYSSNPAEVKELISTITDEMRGNIEYISTTIKDEYDPFFNIITKLKKWWNL